MPADTERGGRGGGAARRKHVFDEFRDDFRAGFGFGGDDGGKPSPRRRRRRCAPLPPAVALFTTAFRLLDRERGDDHGVEGAARRAWSSIFGGGGGGNGG